ncbi:MAG: DUF5916 domain-containing protein [Rhodothermales bacterium]
MPNLSSLRSIPYLCSLLTIFLATASHAQIRSETPVALQRLSSPITFDGFSDEPAWNAIEPLELTVYQPLFKAEPSERTEIRVAYDNDFVYVAGRMYVKDPATISGNSLYRDEYLGDDVMAIIFDTFNDNENALWFATTPTGVRFDWAVDKDAQVGQSFFGSINRSWNTYWDTATQKTDEGWFAEIRIPFSSLGFQDNDGRVVMGISSYRYIAQKNERHLYPDTPPDWPLGWAKASMMQDVEFDGIYNNKPVYITPYVLAGSNFTNTLNDAETAYLSDTDFTREVGLDLKYNLTSNLTMDLTINTDFAQVEADDEQVNLTRLSLFFPEKRQFFQERAGIFDFPTGRRDQLFYSRRIGLNDDGEPVRILGGARIVGRVGNWDLGFIDMQTDKSSELPSENFGVLRLRRQVLNPLSYAGGMITSRLGHDGSYNLGFGADAIIRPVGDEYISLSLAGTADSDIAEEGTINLAKASLIRAQWERRTQRGLSYRFVTKRYGPEYRPELGFVTRENILALGSSVAYGWFGDETSTFRRISPSISGSTILRNTDGSIETGSLGLGLSLERNSGRRISIEADYSFEDLTEALEFPENTEVPIGSYQFVALEASRFDTRARKVFFDGMVAIGSFYDGWKLDIGVGPSWTVSEHLQFEMEYSINRVRFPDRDQSFDAHVGRLRTQVALNTKVSLSAFLQYSTASDLITTNVRFRYNFREGNDLWLVYNEGSNTDRERDFELDRNRPILPTRNNRILLLKYTYTFKG